MGKIREYIFKIFDKAEDILSRDKKSTTLVDNTPTEKPKNTEYTMPYGLKRTKEELIEEDKLIITKLDNKLNLLVTMIQDLHPDQNVQDLIIGEPFLLKVWLAHIAYKTKISDFNNLLTGKIQLKSKKIKCLTDLPLQKTLLN